jgi:hypothetical protein
MKEKNVKASTGDDQGLSESIFQHGAQNEGKDQRGCFIFILSHQVTERSKNEHDENIKYGGIMVGCRQSE